MTEYEKNTIYRSGDILDEQLTSIALVRNYLTQVVIHQSNSAVNKEKMLALWSSLISDGGLDNVDDLLAIVSRTLKTLADTLHSISDDDKGGV